jgi:hypothetical protein
MPSSGAPKDRGSESTVTLRSAPTNAPGSVPPILLAGRTAKGDPGGTPGTCSTASRGSRYAGPAGALSALPETCQRRFRRWNEEGVLDEVLRALAEKPKERGGLDLSECFVGAKKGEARWERPQAGQGHEAHCAGRRLFLSPYAQPERPIGDRAHDPLDEALAEEGMGMIAPHRNDGRNPRPRTGAQALREAPEDRAALRPALRLPSLGCPPRAAGARPSL